MKFELTEKQLQNLGLFLSRVSLRGDEVPAFNELVSVLKNPIKEDEKKK